MNEAFDAGTLNWHAIYCKHRHERVVHEALTTKGINSYLAEYETHVQWGPRRRKLKKNWLPGYVLVELPARDSRIYLNVLQTYGVVKIVGRPWPQLSVIPVEQIESIKLLLGSRQRFEETAYFSEGDWVRVIAGPLAGLTGRVLNPAGHKSRVVVSLDLLQRSIAVEMDSADLRCAQVMLQAA